MAKSDPVPALSQPAGASEARTRDEALWLIMTILLVGVFYLATIRHGHTWGDDFSMYICHARNISEGIAYSQTGFIYNPDKILSPKTYPPIFPILLVPIYKLLGISLTAMKVEIILIFLVSLLVIYLAFRNELAWPYLIALLAILGFNPQLWEFKDNIVSDIPFLLFAYLSFYLIHKAYQVNPVASRTVKSHIMYGLLISISIYLAYGTRSIGLVLIPCLLVLDFVRNRRPSLFAIATVILTSALIYLQNLFSHKDSGYSDQLGFRPLDVALPHSLMLIRSLSEYWVNGYSLIFRLALFGILSGLAILGYFLRIKKKVTCFEIFLPLYLGPFIIFPVEIEGRYLLPILPLYFYYAFVGMQALTRRIEIDRIEIERIAFATLMALILATYIGKYTRLEFGSLREGITKYETRQLFDYVNKETGEKDIILFRKPRALSLFTGRTTAVWHTSPNDSDLWNYFRKINAAYLIVGPPDIEQEDQEFIRCFVERNRDQLQETYSNADFHCYRIKEMP